MPEIHLRQPRVTDSACRSFTRNKEFHDLFIKTNLITCFLHDIAYGDSQSTHIRRFAINSMSKFHVESSWKLHRF